jgi:hypothetical protein
MTTALAMAEPIFWTSVLHSWKTLGPCQWLDATITDFYLKYFWYEIAERPHMRHVDLHTLRTAVIGEEEHQLFRRNTFLPPEGACPITPVGFIIHHAHHFFVVIFDF